MLPESSSARHIASTKRNEVVKDVSVHRLPSFSAAEPPIGSNAVLPFANIPRGRRHRSRCLFVFAGLALLGPVFFSFDSLSENLDFRSMSYSVNSRTLVSHAMGIEVCRGVFLDSRGESWCMAELIFCKF